MPRGWFGETGQKRRKRKLTPQETEALHEDWAMGNLSHADLSRKYGVSRQRIGQILGAKKDVLGPDAITVEEAKHRFHIGSPVIARLINKGEIALFAQRVSASEIADWIERAKQRPCEICGQPIGAIYFKTCPVHRRKTGDNSYFKYPYKVWSPERKRKFRVLVEAWHKRNPERAAAIQKRASRTYFLIKNKGLSREEARRIAHAEIPLDNLPPLVPALGRRK